jgi:hypothetical protein
MGAPLDWLRVVDVSKTLLGKQIGQALAYVGADVVHVEPPGGSRRGHSGEREAQRRARREGGRRSWCRPVAGPPCGRRSRDLAAGGGRAALGMRNPYADESTQRFYSFTVVRHPLAPHLADVVPYVSGVIELDGTQGAGARMIANIVDCDPEQVAVGDEVRVAFDKLSDTFAVPLFAPAGSLRRVPHG